jgi:hypothetical protein
VHDTFVCDCMHLSIRVRVFHVSPDVCDCMHLSIRVRVFHVSPDVCDCMHLSIRVRVFQDVCDCMHLSIRVRVFHVSPDVWLEAARMQTPVNARVILAKAVQNITNSVKVIIRISYCFYF